MRIVVTDGYTVNPGDLSWNMFESFGEIRVYERTPENTVVERCSDADIILTNKTVFSRQTLERLTHTKFISVLATGYNVIDIQAANERGILVCNAPGYGSFTVAQHTIALLLELTNHVGLNSHSVKKGKWSNAADWCYTKRPIIETAGKTLGIIGLGKIGTEVAKLAQALRMQIIYYTPGKRETVLGTATTLENVFKESDFISLHCPLTTHNYHFVDRNLIKVMKTTGFIINTSRGQLIKEQDLADALNNGDIAGAAIDVLSSEPPPADNPLLTAKNCIITPHTAWMSREARQRILQITAENIRSFLQNAPVNVVNR